MKLSECIHEQAVHEALRTKVWPDALHAHAETCPSCSVVMALRDEFQTLARSTCGEAVMPDFSVILAEAEWERRRDVKRRFERAETLTRWGTVAAAIGIVAGISWAAGYLPNTPWPGSSILLPIVLLVGVWVCIERPVHWFTHFKLRKVAV